MNRQQEKLLTILNFFHGLCVENQLRYYIIGGTLLGAVRHGGFIPWDDDIDVGMPRKDYLQLQKVMRSRNGKYVLETPESQAEDYNYNMSKLYDTSTTAVEKNKFETRRGIYLDIFPVDGIGNSEKEVKQNFKPIYALNMFTATRTSTPRAERKWYKNLAIRLSGTIPERFVNTKELILKLDRMCAERSFDECNYVGVLLGGYGTRELFKKESFGTPTEYQFENISVFGPERAEEMLRQVYGDWKTYPPTEKRTSGHDFLLLELDKPYVSN